MVGNFHKIQRRAGDASEFHSEVGRFGLRIFRLKDDRECNESDKCNKLNRPAEGCLRLLFKSFESLGSWRGGISELYHIEEVDSYEA